MGRLPGAIPVMPNAARQLGWTEIDAVLLPDGETTPDLADLAEIAENLHRRELGEIERAEMMAKWAEITAKRADDVSAQDGPKLSTRGRPEGRKPSGINQAARDLGISRQQLQRSAKIASLSPEAKAAARDHGIETQAALLEAAKAPTPAAQVEVIERRAAYALMTQKSRAKSTLEPTRTSSNDAGAVV